ncbi:mitochondrial carrier domain-containing protein [Trichophaea hybrida]|nr:mitochondrial carrier domain-containing protein [Trichophaea hybrida]
MSTTTKENVSPVVKEEVAVAKSAALSGVRSFVAGGVGGVCAVITGHPFDLVKVRLQTAEKGVYKGALDVVKQTIAREGPIRGLYAGISAPLYGVTPMFAVSFWGYDVGKNLVRKFSHVDEKAGYSIAQISAAGFFSAIPMTLITAPFERIKIMLQLQGQQKGPPKYSSSFDVARQLYKTGGIQNVFRGAGATLARDGPGSAAYFATYEYLKRRLSPEDGKLSLAAVSFAGGSAGVAMWILVFPVDTVKSRLQGSTEKTSVGKGFFPGVGPAMLRSFPANAATFVGLELTYKAWDKVF